jgi:hypothetical protein
MAYGFEVYNGNGLLYNSSSDYGWVVLDQWVVSPVVHGRETTKYWVVPPEFTDFKLFVGGAYLNSLTDSLADFTSRSHATTCLYDNLGYSVTPNGQGNTIIEITLREVYVPARPYHSKTTIYAQLVGR